MKHSSDLYLVAGREPELSACLERVLESSPRCRLDAGALTFDHDVFGFSEPLDSLWRHLVEFSNELPQLSSSRNLPSHIPRAGFSTDDIAHVKALAVGLLESLQPSVDRVRKIAKPRRPFHSSVDRDTAFLEWFDTTKSRLNENSLTSDFTLRLSKLFLRQRKISHKNLEEVSGFAPILVDFLRMRERVLEELCRGQEPNWAGLAHRMSAVAFSEWASDESASKSFFQFTLLIKLQSIASSFRQLDQHLHSWDEFISPNSPAIEVQLRLFSSSLRALMRNAEALRMKDALQSELTAAYAESPFLLALASGLFDFALIRGKPLFFVGADALGARLSKRCLGAFPYERCLGSAAFEGRGSEDAESIREQELPSVEEANFDPASLTRRLWRM
jgi:hypothetical protein